VKISKKHRIYIIILFEQKSNEKISYFVKKIKNRQIAEFLFAFLFKRCIKFEILGKK